MVHRLLGLSQAGYNTYFGLSTFAQGWHLVNGQQRYRTKLNAISQKALFLDIDVAPKSIYSNWQEAFKALCSFVKATRLPEPLVTISGKGLHVLWTMTEAVPTDHWLLMVGLLKSLTMYHRLDVDKQRTEDPTSSPRLPGTRNYDTKDGSINEVKLLLWGREVSPYQLTAQLFNQVQELQIPFSPGKLTSDSSPILQAYNGPPISERLLREVQEVNEGFKGIKREPYRIVKECRQIQAAPFSVGRFHWYSMISVMAHCQHGDLIAHELSKMDPRYSETETNTVFAQMIDGGSGPAKCETFEKYNAGGCDGCVYRGKIKSPILLGDTAGAATVKLSAPVVSSEKDACFVDVSAAPVMDVVPFKSRKFEVIPGTGVVWKRKVTVDTDEEVKDYDEEDKSGAVTKPIILCDSEIYITSTYVDSSLKDGQRSYIVRKVSKNRAPQDLKLNIEDHLGSAQLIKWLGHHQLLPNSEYDRKMYEFMRAHLHAAQRTAHETQIRDRFGWTTLQDVKAGQERHTFIVGDTMYSDLPPMKTYMAEKCSAAIEYEFTQAGNLETWKHFPYMYKHLNQYDAQLLMCAAFAAPFMRFGNGTATNIMLALWDTQGGRGKTTLLQGINSVWGHPLRLMCKHSDTLSARYQLLSLRQNLPVCMDEITMMDEADQASMIFDLANGQQYRKSLPSGQGLAKTGDWSTVVYFSANTSIHETMAKFSPQSQAPIMRVLEFRCNFPSYSGTETGKYIEDTIAILDNHYGLAGREFIQRCLNIPGVFEAVEQKVRAWDQAVRRESEERFWTTALGTILEVGQLAVDFGILPYDMKLLREYTLSYLDYMRTKVRSNKTNGNSLLGDYLNASINQTLIVKSAERVNDTKKPDPKRKSEFDEYVLQYPLGELAIRIEADTRRTYVSATHLNKWCSVRRLSLDTLLQDLIACGSWQPGNKHQISLGAHVSVLPRTRVMCYVLDGLKLDLPSAATEPILKVNNDRIPVAQ